MFDHLLHMGRGGMASCLRPTKAALNRILVSLNKEVQKEVVQDVVQDV